VDLGVVIEHLRTFLSLQWFSTGTVVFSHPQDILENCGAAFDYHNFGEMLLGSRTV